MLNRLRRSFLTALILVGLAAPAVASPGAVSANRMRAPVVYDTSIGAGVDVNGFTSLPLRSGASRYFVNSSTGSDSNSCLQAKTASTPKATIAAGISCIATSAGDQVLIAEGTTYVAGLPNIDGKGGFSPLYPTVIQTYDPADALNEAKYGRGDQRSARPVVNTGGSVMSLTCCRDDGTASYVAIRGLDFNPGNTINMAMNVAQSGGAPNNYWLYENNLFRYTGISFNEDTGSTSNRAQHIVVRNNSFYGMWSDPGHSGGMYLANITGMVVEDNVFYHVGWKIGASRSDTPANGGATIFRHAVYQQENVTATIRRNLMMEGSATGCSCRGDTIIYDNLLIDNPLSIIAGKGDNYGTIRPTGADFAVWNNAILGSTDINTSNPRGSAFTTGNGRNGSYFRNNLIARSNNVGGSNVAVFSLESEFPQPSYITIEDNIEFSWGNASQTIVNGGAYPAQNFPTFNRNAWTAAASGTNVNISTRSQAFAYTDDQLYTALGFTGANAAARRQAFIDYVIAHPEAHIQRRGRSLLLAGYNVRQMAPPAAPTLAALTLSSTSFTRGTAASGAVTGGVTAFSDLTTASLPSGLTINSMLRTWSWDGSGSGAASGNWTLTETLAGATNSPRASTIAYSITDPAPTLGTLALDSTSYTRGTSASGAITGATSGSTLTTSGIPSGLTINSGARTWAWDGSGSGAASGSWTLTETLAGATNTPKANTISYSISAPAWTPASTTLAVWYDISDSSTLFQNTACTTPVTADGQAVKCIADKSGNGLNAIAQTSNGYIYRTNSGKPYLEATSADYFASTGSGAFFNASGEHSIVAVASVNTTGQGGEIFQNLANSGGASLGLSAGSLITRAFNTSGGTHAQDLYFGSAPAANTPFVAMGVISTTSAEAFLDNVGDGSATVSTTLATTNGRVWTPIHINGRFYELWVTKSAYTSTDRSNAQTYGAAQY